MTVLKIKRKQSSQSCIQNNLHDDMDGPDLFDSGCELIMVENQTCNIPYDLYDLLNLKEVLSLKTWNSCLTEEERFSLSVYIPDMDHETFLHTLQELLNGDELFFGSPLDDFFCRMKSGFYSPQVVPVRESLRYLEKCKHYHLLRLYHENMNTKFFDMKKAWMNCEVSTTVEEKIKILKKKKKKPLLLLDLNAMPQDGDCLNSPNYKKMKPSDSTIETLNKKSKGKGLMKARPVEMNLLSNFNSQVVTSEPWEMRRMPKGVLKIKNRSEFARLERPITVQFPQLLQHMEDVNKEGRGQKNMSFPAIYKRKNSARAKISPSVNNMGLALSNGTEFEIEI